MLRTESEPRRGAPRTGEAGTLTTADFTAAGALSRLRARWVGVAVATCGYSLLIVLLSNQFGYDRDVADMPVLLATACFIGAGVVFAVTLPRLITSSARSDANVTAQLLAIVIAGGFVARLILFASEPILEDDYQRYLWDGAVSAHALNPYDVAPRTVIDAGPAHPLSGLAADSGHVLRRVNHPSLTTIYPPVAQAAFALAHWIAPWSLTAWRSVLLLCDGATLLALLALLQETGRSRLWAAMYWINPLVLKEGFNSAHMEPVVIALVMLALWLTVKHRSTYAAMALGFAAGAKLWPALLLPVIVRPLTRQPLQLAATLGLFASMLLLWAAPMLWNGVGETSGLRAYAETWHTNSALFPLLEWAASGVLIGIGLAAVSPALAVKMLLALTLVGAAIMAALPPVTTAESVITRAGGVVALLVLLSPAQYPWYLLWLLPFLAFWPSPAFLLLCATIPLYYATFHFAARETLEQAGPILLALIWLPVWALLATEAWRAFRSPRAATAVSGGAA